MLGCLYFTTILCQEERTYYSTVLPCSVGLLRATNVVVVLFQFRSKKKERKTMLQSA